MKKNYDKIAEVLMKDEWFTERYFNSRMNLTDLLDLPYFEEIKNTLESRETPASVCELPLDELDCSCDLDCEHCSHNREYIDIEYHFPDSPSREECQEQINILKSFHII